MLECTDLSASYGQLVALRSVSIKVAEGQVVSIVGGNGAGKTTLLRLISGLHRPRTGQILFQGRDLTRVPPAEIVRMGIAQVPTGRQIFRNLSVRENLRLGAYTRTGQRSQDQAVADDLERMLDLFPILRTRSRQAAGTMSGGEQQMLAIARAMMARPRLLLLDEPSLGLAPQVLEGIFNVLQQLNREDRLTILLVEQNAHLALDFASFAYVLETGSVVDRGPTAELKTGDTIRRIYLGVEA